MRDSLFRKDAAQQSEARTKAALARLRVDPSGFFRFPHEVQGLADLAGALVPGELVVIGAKPGNGKSTLAHNLVRWALRQGIPTFVFGTEQTPEVLAIKQVCSNRGINPRLVLKPEPHEMADGTYAQAVLAVEQGLIELDLDSHLLQYSTDPVIDRALFAEGIEWARSEMDAKVFILDHLHHMRIDGPDRTAEVGRTIIEAKETCVKEGMIGIVFAQLRRYAGVAALEPPGKEDFAQSADIERAMDQGFTLWRPLRLDLTKEQVKTMRKDAERGVAPAADVYEPFCMGVQQVKDRLGDVFNKRCLLTLDKGKLRDYEAVPERDRYETSYEALRAA